MAESIESKSEEPEVKEELAHLIEVGQDNVNRKNRSFSFEFKRDAIAYAEKTTNLRAAKTFKVDTKRIREWRQNKQVIIEACEKGIKKHRLKGAGRKVAHKAMEEDLIRWYEEQKSKGVMVSRKLVSEKAKELYNETCDESKKGQFVASAGWLQKFQKRYGLSFREKKVNKTEPESSGSLSMVVLHDVSHVLTVLSPE